MTDSEFRDPNRPLLLVASDSHVGPRPQDLRPYCDERYLEQFDEFTAEFCSDEAVERTLQRRWLTFSDEWRNGWNRNAKTEGHHDPNARLRDMDRDGVAGNVLFHNSFNGQPFPFDVQNGLGNGVPQPDDRELAGVGRKVYNRWLSDFCSVQPERSVGLAQLPMWDLDAALNELVTASKSELRGVNFPAPGAPGMPTLDEPKFDEFFAACAALDMPLTTHIGAFPPTPLLDGVVGHEVGLLDTTDWGIRTITLLTMHGVFERHPNLKLIITEHPGIYWNELTAKLDSVFFSPIIRKTSSLKRPPSEYVKTNVWIGNSFQSRSEAEEAIELGLEDRYMWGSDYPHPEGTFSYSSDPNEPSMTRLSVANTYHDLPLDKVRMLLGENAVNCYPRLSLEDLEEVAHRIGPSPEALSAAPDLSSFELMTTTGTLAFRTQGAWS
jgi:predicted TIM-barrel fold metal-dependent hydrolase